MIFLTLYLILALNTSSPQQTVSKAEAKAYSKIIAKPSTKACNKFIASYPKSPYLGEIVQTRDSLIYFSGTREDDAASLLTFINKYQKSRYAAQAIEILLQSFKADVFISEEFGNKIKVRILQRQQGSWAQNCDTLLTKYSIYDNPDGSTLVDAPEVVNIHGRILIYFSYLNWWKESKKMEYAVNLLSPDGSECTSAIFYGMNMAANVDGESPVENYLIEGRSPEELAQGGLSFQQAFLWQKILENKKLQRISQEDEMSDDAINWWLENNPKAMTSASVAKFGTLPAECSIVQQYKKASKESSKQFNAAIIDFRGYTMVVAYTKATKQYTLIWVEPMAEDKYRDRYLNNIYFDSAGTTLNMFYYQGRKTFKLYINLASKTIRR